jgi:hypothetical protein
MWLQTVWDVRSRSRSFGIGLSSAFDILFLEPGGPNIIHRCIQRLSRAPDFAENLRDVFCQSLSDPEELFFSGETNTLYNDALAINSLDQQICFDQLRADFANALIFQNLLYRNAKFHRSLRWHHVELYIRIRNSILFIFGRNPPNSVHRFGISLCPPLYYSEVQEIQELDLGTMMLVFLRRYTEPEVSIELKFQFLDCLIRFWGTVFEGGNQDLIVAAIIIDGEGIGSPVSSGQKSSGISKVEKLEEEYKHATASSVYVVGVHEVARPDSGGHNTHGKRGEADGYGSFPGTQCTGFEAEGPGESIRPAQHASGIYIVTETKEDAELDAASYVSDVHEMDRRDSADLNTDGKKEKKDSCNSFFTGEESLHGSIWRASGVRKTDVASSVGDIHEVDNLGPGDYDTDGNNGVGNSYENLYGVQHTPAGVDPGKPRLSQHGINGKGVEDAQLKASFRRLCLQVRERLLSSSKSSFSSEYAFIRVREILCPPQPEPTVNPPMTTSPV